MQARSHSWNISEDCHMASQQAAEFLAQSIKEAIAANNVCHVVLPGGNTPQESLRMLVKKNLSWDKVHWYPGDERCVPQGDAERNDLMLDNTLWKEMPGTHIHRIPAELGAEQAAKLYQEEIKNITAFDIAYLGMGEDGHTASLFPGNAALTEEASVVPVYNSPKLPPERVSLSLETLRKAKTRIVLSCGRGKAAIINRIKNGESLPVNSIGDIEWFIDEAANNT